MDRIAQASPLDRADLFRRAALASGPAWLPAIMEKDFWVCWTLRRMFEVMKVRPQLIFKGGTSLSKVFNAIERFSEDVDLSLSRRDLGFADDHDPEQSRISKKEARRRLNALVDYQDMQAMIFGKAPDWDDIVRELQQLEKRINS